MKRRLACHFLIFFLGSCVSYDQTYQWVPGQNQGGVVLGIRPATRGIASLVLTNQSQEVLTLRFIPRDTIIGDRFDLNAATGRTDNPGVLKGEPRRIPRSRVNEESDIYGRFLINQNPLVLQPGETAINSISLVNWDRATKNFLFALDILVRGEEGVSRIRLETPAENFYGFPASSLSPSRGPSVRIGFALGAALNL